MRIKKLSTVFERCAEYVAKPDSIPSAYYTAISHTARSVALSDSAEQFADPYAFGDGANELPQDLSRPERALLFGFLAAIAKSQGK